MKAIKLVFIILVILICAVLVASSVVVLYTANVLQIVVVLFCLVAGLSAMSSVYSELVRG